MTTFFASLFRRRHRSPPDSGDTEATARVQAEAAKARGNEALSHGDLAAAATCYQEAIRLHPRYAEAYNNLGFVLGEQGRLEDAVAAYREAIALDSNLGAAHRNLGFALLNLGQTDAAEQSFRDVIVNAPADAAALMGLGVIAAQRGDFPRAETLLRRALAADEDNAAAHINLGHALKAQGRLSEAAAAYQCAIRVAPSYAEAHDSLGTALRELGRKEESIASYRQAVALREDYAEAHNNLGSVLLDLERLGEAEACYQRALRIQPDFAAAHSNLGILLQRLGRLDEALASHRRALQIQPDLAEAHSNLGYVFHDLGRLDDAEASYRRALQIKPNNAEAHSNLGMVLQHLGRLGEAEASYRQALQVDGNYVNAHDNLLLALNYDPDKSREEIFAAHREYNELFGLPQRQKWPVHGNSREPHRRLRVGYVSPDLHQHSVAYFIEPLLREHDRQAVEVFCYAEVSQPDAVTMRLQNTADHWLTTIGLSAEALARRIADDEIDILVDLAGHTAHNRLSVFARKPAPVQVTWLGYPATTGLDAMDYRLVDAVTDPPGDADAWASETLVRLESGFLCYAAPANAPAPATPPCLANGYVTFGSFNNPAKLSPSTLDVWAKLLDRVPNSRLLVKGKCFAEAAAGTAFLAKLAQRGVDSQRVTLLGLLPALSSHLAAYAQVDIALDPFPYNGTTTTCEALWMGVPVISLRGDRHAGRVGASLLTQVGLPELVATSTQAYLDIAAALATDIPRLSELRRTLRERMLASPLCAAPAFARKVEAAYRDMWRRHCATTSTAQAEAAKARGNEHLSCGHLDEAAHSYLEAIRLNSGYAEAYNNLGHVRMRQKNFADAETMLNHALALSPDLVAAHFNLGVVAQEQRRFDQALACFRRTNELMPTHAESHWRLGIILNDRGDNEAAVAAYLRAVAIDPELAEVHVNLGAAYMQLRRYDEAENHCKAALAINQRRMTAGDPRSCAIKPDYFHAAHWNLALMYLMRGDYEAGLDHFERRLHLTGVIPAWATGTQAFMSAYGVSRYWKPEEDLAGETLLVWTEQGLGDSLMMMRYLPLLKGAGVAKLLVQADPPLVRLLERVPEVDAVIPKTREMPPDSFYRHCALTSLPYLLKTRLDSIPNRVPYLDVPDDMRQRWAARLSDRRGVKVGIAWGGNKNMDRDELRSIPLKRFAPLLQVSGITWLSLQKGEPAAQLRELGWPVLDWMDECADLLDTAALVAELDLVISVDTAIVHLVGALGRPVWLLNRYESEWRWMLEREDSIWYPSLRIFRQPRLGDWDSVFARMATELAALAVRRSPCA